jgi:hypothetical protein
MHRLSSLHTTSRLLGRHQPRKTRSLSLLDFGNGDGVSSCQDDDDPASAFWTIFLKKIRL